MSIRAAVELSDWELVQRCQAGEIEAFQELVARYHHKVFVVILGILNHREDAQEVAQETFFRAYKKIRGFRGGSAFYTWLYRIAVNLSIDFQRRQKRNPMEFRESLDDVAERQEESGRDPFQNLQDKEIGKRLLAAIKELTPDHRAVIVMRAVEGLSYKDISRILGCSEGTVMSRLHYARKKLQEKLGPFL
ncbi:MAG TPA: sigma-70 family RNA polymerase sigma factor [Candidatus Binatia bacterium]|jgi:RNA polymerase sigma-70 factor (ECF subfamily)|nr:sigma-70 family RNA polymerase sigma factor [Candidatus Binatia bacterium]